MRKTIALWSEIKDKVSLQALEILCKRIGTELITFGNGGYILVGTEEQEKLYREFAKEE